MVRLFFDIETIPSPDEFRAVSVEVLKKKIHNTEKTEVEIYESTSFDGAFGRICCIGIIKEDALGKVIQKEVLEGSEKEILTEFWQTASNVQQFIGHNIWAFDLPFIYKRSIIHHVKTRPLNFARYRNVPIYDTMMEWDLWNMERGRAVKLDTLAKVLGLPTSKDEMEGSDVWKYYQAGRTEDICKYCMKDVELTRKVFYRMNFLISEDGQREDSPYQ